MRNLAILSTDCKRAVLERKVNECVSHLAVVQDIFTLLATRHLVQRRLRNVDATTPYQFGHLSEEEGEQQGADVTSVNICIGHDDDAAIAQLGMIEVFADAALQGLNECSDFLKSKDLVEPCSLHIQELSAQRQDRLTNMVAPTLGTSACAVTFNNEQFGLVHITRRAVGEFVRHAAGIECTLALD